MSSGIMSLNVIRSAVVLLALLAGCTTSPLTGRDQYLVVSESSAVSQSAADGA